MPQFTAYKNSNAATKARFPFLLNVQSNLLDELETRVVIPLMPLTALKGKALTRLMPIVKIADADYVLLTPQLAGIARKELGATAADLSDQRDTIMAAMDFLLTGI
ncbi:MAG: CcdB family protein [Moraxellaceae bacterium]